MAIHYQIIYCTCPNIETAREIAEHLVKKKLAACVNILPAVTSVYEWQGEFETETEHLLMIKTCDYHYVTIETEIQHLHPYDVPEIIAVPVSHGSPDYLKWIDTCILSE